MDRKLTQRQKKQSNGLLEPYTVMLQGRPVVVRASSIEEASIVAQKEVSPKATNGNEEDGDDR